eukprot:m.54464 g.54464  ORF g.54464 m.54464 type:complete len:129 (+) comp34373_c0_seq4:1176-1562(+)
MDMRTGELLPVGKMTAFAMATWPPAGATLYALTLPPSLLQLCGSYGQERHRPGGREDFHLYEGQKRCDFGSEIRLRSEAWKLDVGGKHGFPFEPETLSSQHGRPYHVCDSLQYGTGRIPTGQNWHPID